jgi:hypothetical protein
MLLALMVPLMCSLPMVYGTAGANRSYWHWYQTQLMIPQDCHARFALSRVESINAAVTALSSTFPASL